MDCSLGNKYWCHGLRSRVEHLYRDYKLDGRTPTQSHKTALRSSCYLPLPPSLTTLPKRPSLSARHPLSRVPPSYRGGCEHTLLYYGCFCAVEASEDLLKALWALSFLPAYQPPREALS